MAKILTFHEALKNSETAKHRHLLLGNGFSIACRPDIFVYGKLFERANFADIPRARKVFDALGTSDFERVIRALRDYSRINPVYAPNGAGAQEASLADADALREVLVRTIASSHPGRPADIAPAEYECCKKFLSNFERIFTLNYDLLLYWALMQDVIKPEVKCDDGFRKPDGGANADYVSWEPENIHGQNIYYLGTMFFVPVCASANVAARSSGDNCDHAAITSRNSAILCVRMCAYVCVSRFLNFGSRGGNAGLQKPEHWFDPSPAAILTRSYKTPAESGKVTYVGSYVGRRLHIHSETSISFP